MATSGKLELEIQRVCDWPEAPDDKALKRWARAALKSRRGRVGLLIRLVDAPESASLNQTYRGKAGPTNVLAFPFQPPSGTKSRLLGDLVICAPVVLREAAEQGKPLAHHWAHLVVHGVSHLLGYDHASEHEAARMEKRERNILAGLNIPDPYRDKTESDATATAPGVA